MLLPDMKCAGLRHLFSALKPKYIWLKPRPSIPGNIFYLKWWRIDLPLEKSKTPTISYGKYMYIIYPDVASLFVVASRLARHYNSQTLKPFLEHTY